MRWLGTIAFLQVESWTSWQVVCDNLRRMSSKMLVERHWWDLVQGTQRASWNVCQRYECSLSIQRRDNCGRLVTRRVQIRWLERKLKCSRDNTDDYTLKRFWGQRISRLRLLRNSWTSWILRELESLRKLFRCDNWRSLLHRSRRDNFHRREFHLQAWEEHSRDLCREHFHCLSS